MLTIGYSILTGRVYAGHSADGIRFQRKIDVTEAFWHSVIVALENQGNIEIASPKGHFEISMRKK